VNRATLSALLVLDRNS